jgi:hypothetical protein
MQEADQLKLTEIIPGREEDRERGKKWAKAGATIEREMIELDRNHVIRRDSFLECASNCSRLRTQTQISDEKLEQQGISVSKKCFRVKLMRIRNVFSSLSESLFEAALNLSHCVIRQDI